MLKLKELVESEAIGKVLSSEVVASYGLLDRESLPSGLKYFADRSIGGNPFHIGFMHREFSSNSSHLQTLLPIYT